MNINDTFNGSNGTYQLASWFEDGPAGQVFEARARFVNGEEADVLVFGAPLGSSQLARTEFLAQGQRVAQIHAQLTQRGEERAIPISYEMSEAHLFFVIARPTGTPLTEQIVLSGSLPEQEALLLPRRMSALLDVLHEELGLAAAPQGFLQVRWEGQAGDLWLPVWHAAAPISPARRREDLLEFGATMHLAMLGHKPRVLWGQPVSTETAP